MYVTVVTMVNLDSGDNGTMFYSIAGQYNLVFSEYEYD